MHASILYYSASVQVAATTAVSQKVSGQSSGERAGIPSARDPDATRSTLLHTFLIIRKAHASMHSNCASCGQLALEATHIFTVLSLPPLTTLSATKSTQYTSSV
jgi:hypothetical protein